MVIFQVVTQLDKLYCCMISDTNIASGRGMGVVSTKSRKH